MKCIISKNSKFEILFKLKNFPIFAGVSKNKKFIKKNLNFWINKNTGTVQIYPRVRLDILYKRGHGSGTIGKTWSNHHEFFFKFIESKIKKKILEIGAGDNSLTNKINNYEKIDKFYSVGKNISNYKKNKKIKIINSFFSRQTMKREINDKLNCIIHSHFFEHLYDPNNFLRIIYNILDKNGFHCFSVPNMTEMLKLFQTNVVNFEHPYYYDKELIKKILLNNGFKIIKTKKFLKNHSIMFITKKMTKPKVQKYSKYIKNKKIFTKLYSAWKKDKLKLDTLINTEKPVFLFGAHIFSQVILHLIEKKEKILGILDNDKNKIGKFLYGFDAKVFNPSILKEYKKPYVYMRLGSYTNEVKKQILRINKRTKFV